MVYPPFVDPISALKARYLVIYNFFFLKKQSPDNIRLPILISNVFISTSSVSSFSLIVFLSIIFILSRTLRPFSCKTIHDMKFEMKYWVPGPAARFLCWSICCSQVCVIMYCPDQLQCLFCSRPEVSNFYLCLFVSSITLVDD